MTQTKTIQSVYPCPNPCRARTPPPTHSSKLHRFQFKQEKLQAAVAGQQKEAADARAGRELQFIGVEGEQLRLDTVAKLAAQGQQGFGRASQAEVFKGQTSEVLETSEV